MEQQSLRKVWTTPELIVLVRNRPEEGVLAACKVTGNPGGINSTWNGCTIEVEVGVCNTLCQTEAPS